MRWQNHKYHPDVRYRKMKVPVMVTMSNGISMFVIYGVSKWYSVDTVVMTISFQPTKAVDSHVFVSIKDYLTILSFDLYRNPYIFNRFLSSKCC